MTCYALAELVPDIHPTAYIPDEATVIGQAVLEAGVSLWPGAVLRADNARIHIGEGSNVQEGAVLHVDPGCPLTVGKHVTVGHQAMLHGCTIGDESLIGIQAVVLNRAVIGRHCLVGAGALVTEGKTFPDRSLILGAPARVARTLSDEEVADLKASAEHYRERGQTYRQNLRRL